MTGVNFRSACNQHDTCYALQSPRQTRDTAFAGKLNAICRNSTLTGSPGRNTCMGFANAYSGAVRLYGNSTYQDAGHERARAVWHREMDSNPCPK